MNPEVTSFMEQARALYLQQTGDAVAANQMALQTLANLRDQQAAALSYFDIFWVAAVLGVIVTLLVPLMKRSVAEKGKHVGAE